MLENHLAHTNLWLSVQGRLVTEEAVVGYFDDVLQLPGLLFHLCSQEEGSRSNGITMKTGEWMKHVETMHIYDGGVDC